MSFSIREYLTENGVALRDSVYEASDPAMLDFQIYSGDFYKLTEKNGKKALRYKNAVNLMGFEMLTGCLEIFRDIDPQSGGKRKRSGRKTAPFSMQKIIATTSFQRSQFFDLRICQRT